MGVWGVVLVVCVCVGVGGVVLCWCVCDLLIFFHPLPQDAARFKFQDVAVLHVYVHTVCAHRLFTPPASGRRALQDVAVPRVSVHTVCSHPLPQDAARFKTSLCHAFADQGTCKYGAVCNYAHGAEELRAGNKEGAPGEPLFIC